MISTSSRRTFVKAASSSLAGYLFAGRAAMATPLNLPIGLQLYTVGKEMDQDPAGTLRAVAAAGYKQVELSPLDKTPAKELKKALDDAGLQNPSGHYLLPDLLSNLQQKIDFAHLLGQEFMVLAAPWVADPSRFKLAPNAGQMELFSAIISGLTLDDWKWNAEQCNELGEQIKKAGMQLAYHTHNFEWKSYGHTTAYEEFARLTDPQLVRLELDCGWVVVAGLDPAKVLAQYANRCSLLHVKDFKAGFTPRTTIMEDDAKAPVPTELGRGEIKYEPVFAAAKKARIRAIFVEQEAPFADMPPLEAIKVDYEYMKNLKP
jgi:sugar phosphate isomerase/epimerase